MNLRLALTWGLSSGLCVMALMGDACAAPTNEEMIDNGVGALRNAGAAAESARQAREHAKQSLEHGRQSREHAKQSRERARQAHESAARSAAFHEQSTKDAAAFIDGLVYAVDAQNPFTDALPGQPSAPTPHGNESDATTLHATTPDAASKPIAKRSEATGRPVQAIAATDDQAEEEAVARAAAERALATTRLAQAPAPVVEEAPRVRFTGLVKAPNQKSVANAVDALPETHPLHGGALDAFEHGNLERYFDSLSGEVHATTATSVMAASTLAREVPLAQLRDNLTANMIPGTPPATWGDTPAGTAPISTAKPLWAHVGGSWQKVGGRDHSARGDQNSAGLFLGTDHDMGNGWRLGGALGFTDSHLKVRSLDSKANTTSYSALLYGGKVLPMGPGALHAIVGTGYTWNDVKTKRHVNAGGLDQTLRATYGVSAVQWFADLGYALPVAQGLTLQPYAGIAYADNHARGFKEYGGSAALSGHRQRSGTTTSTLGLRGKQDIKLGSAAGQLTAGLGWRHNTGDVQSRTRMSFNMGDSFTVTGAPIARDVALVETGVMFSLNRNTALGASYIGQFGAGQRDNTVSVNLGHRF